MRLSRETRLRNADDARFGLLHNASELKLIGTLPLNRGQGTLPTVERNGWSARNSLENVWSLLLLILNAVPMSAKAARLTASPMIGMRYSKFPSSCVSPPTDVNERGKAAGLLPPDPVNVPSVIAACGGSPATC